RPAADRACPLRSGCARPHSPGRERTLCTEDTVSRRHHARDLRARGPYCATRRAGAKTARAPDPVSRRFAPASPDRGRIVPGTGAATANERGEAAATDRQRAMSWAHRLRRVFAIDIETCRQCGGKLRVIAS